MGLRACPECGGKVSSDAPLCPHCGRRKPGSGGSVVLGVFVAAFVLVALMAAMNQALLSPEEKAARQAQEAEAARRRETENAERQAAAERRADALAVVEGSLRGSSEDFGGSIEGIVENKSDQTIRYARIVFTVYDLSGAQIGTAEDFIRDLKSGGRWSFKASYFGRRIGQYELKELTWR